MSTFTEYFAGECSISLENVTYNKLKENDGDVTLKVKDSIEIKEKQNDVNSLEFIVSRSLTFDPKSLAEINVSFGVVLELNDQLKNSEQLDYARLRDEIISEDSVLMSIIMSRISMLISQLTSSYGERPIVTPPSFLKDA